MRRSLPRLCDQAGKVARAHGDRNSDLAVLETAVHQLSAELLDHLQDEEDHLFSQILAHIHPENNVLIRRLGGSF